MEAVSLCPWYQTEIKLAQSGIFSYLMNSTWNKNEWNNCLIVLNEKWHLRINILSIPAWQQGLTCSVGESFFRNTLISFFSFFLNSFFFFFFKIQVRSIFQRTYGEVVALSPPGEEEIRHFFSDLLLVQAARPPPRLRNAGIYLWVHK